jgi:hypothetical protein
MPTASLAAFAVLLGASAAYGLSAGGASNVKDLGIGAKPPASNTIAQATPTPPPATTSSSPDTVPQATPTPPSAASNSSTPPSSPKPSKKAKAKKPATTTPSTASQPAGSNPPPSSGGTTTHHHQTTHRHHTTTPSGPPSWFTDADPPYDAFNYGGGSKPKDAIDGSTSTAWKTRSTGNGIVIDTGQAQPYSHVGIATSTPGFAVTIYWSNDNKTATGNPASDGWKRSGSASSVAKYQQIHIKGNQPRYLLIYVTKLPSGGKTSINEVRLVL